MSDIGSDIAPSAPKGWTIAQPGISASGGKVASPLGQWSWALFEGARNPHVLLITIYIFAPYFYSQLVGAGQQIDVRQMEGRRYADPRPRLTVHEGARQRDAEADQSCAPKEQRSIKQAVLAGLEPGVPCRMHHGGGKGCHNGLPRDDHRLEQSCGRASPHLARGARLRQGARLNAPSMPKLRPNKQEAHRSK